MQRDARNSDLIRVEAGGIHLPPAMDRMCSFFRIARDEDRFFVIHEVLERNIVGSSTKEIYYMGTLVGEAGFHPGILRSCGQKYSCALGKATTIGSFVVAWPNEWRSLEGYPVSKPGLMQLRRRSPIELDGIRVQPSKPLDNRPGWRRFPFPGFVEFPKDAKAEILLAINLIERRGFGVYYKSDEVPSVQKLPWCSP